MPRFFLSRQMLEEELPTITGSDARHIACSLRMTAGEILTLCDGEGTDYQARLETVSPEGVTLSVLAKAPSGAEPPYRATLYQCLAKRDKMETVIQKAVECGVFAVAPVLSSRCVVRLTEQEGAKKVERWQKIANEAAGQCGRGRLVRVLPLLSYRMALEAMAQDELSFLCYENEETKSIKDLFGTHKTPATVSFLVGPEGGLSPAEREAAGEKGIPSVSLGRRILRTETVSGFVLALLSAFYEM